MVERLLAPNNPQAGPHASYLVRPTQPSINYAQPSTGQQVQTAIIDKGIKQGGKYLYNQVTGQSSTLTPAAEAALINSGWTGTTALTAAQEAALINSGWATSAAATAGAVPVTGLSEAAVISSGWSPAVGTASTMLSDAASALTALGPAMAIMGGLAYINSGTKRNEATTGGKVQNGKVVYTDSKSKGMNQKVSDNLFDKQLIPAIDNMIKNGVNLDGADIRIGVVGGDAGGIIEDKLLTAALKASGMSPQEQMLAKEKVRKAKIADATYKTAIQKAFDVESRLRPQTKKEDLIGKQITPDGLIWNSYSVRGTPVAPPKGVITITKEMLDSSTNEFGGLGRVSVKFPGEDKYTDIGYLRDGIANIAGLKNNPYSKANAINGIAALAKSKSPAPVAQKLPTVTQPSYTIPVKTQTTLNAPVASNFDKVRNKFISDQQAGKYVG